MRARKCGDGASGAPAHLPGRQVRLRPAVRAGARPAWNRPSTKLLDKLLKNQAKMQENLAEVQTDIAKLKKDTAQLKKDVAQLKTDTAVTNALVAVNLTPVAASLVLGVLYFVHNNF